MKVKDVLVIRQYENAAGIKVAVEIDLIQGKASLVEPDGNGAWRAKEWLFAERKTSYLRTWTVIMRLMETATKDAIKMIEQYQKTERGKKK